MAEISATTQIFSIAQIWAMALFSVLKNVRFAPKATKCCVAAKRRYVPLAEVVHPMARPYALKHVPR
jgi:hypothetical protein